MTHHMKPEDFAEAAKLAEAAGLWHLAAANWGMAVKVSSRREGHVRSEPNLPHNTQ